ncbi:hypothetical protein ACHAW6_004143 [Cyclotella cf. meneghiniana]
MNPSYSIGCSDQDELNIAYAKSCINPISFEDVFNTLQDYERQNNGSLTISPDHLSFPKIIDALASLGIDSVILKRWLQRLALVRSRELCGSKNGRQQDNSLHCASITDPDLGKWIQTQLDYYSLHNQGLPNPLNSWQLRMLREIGLQSLLNLRSAAEEEANTLKGKTLGDCKTSQVNFEIPQVDEREAISFDESSSGLMIWDVNESEVVRKEIQTVIKQESTFDSKSNNNPHETSFASKIASKETINTTASSALSGINAISNTNFLL